MSYMEMDMNLADEEAEEKELARQEQNYIDSMLYEFESANNNL